MIRKLLIALVLMYALPGGIRDLRAAQSLPAELRRRDPVSGEVRTMRVELDPRQVGIVVVDMWNWHWCKTATARVAALVPRMDRVIEEARKLGMTVFWCPSDVADNYVGTPAYERAFACVRVPLPELRPLECPPAPDGGGCTCGVERCVGNYGWDGMHSGLRVEDGDFMPNDVEALYSLARERGLRRLIYMGVHTQVCLLGKSIGLRNMTRAGFECVLARDLTDAHARYDPAAGVTPDGFTSEVVAHFERHLAATLDFGETLRQAGCRGPGHDTERVRFAPWGTRERPHFFEQAVVVTLSLPNVDGGVIRFTRDGSEPGASSEPYEGPIRLTAGARLRAAGFESGHRVTPVAEGVWERLPPKPPAPEVPLWDLKPVRVAGPGHAPSSAGHYFTGGSREPQRDRNNRGEPLRIRRETYAEGWGVHAPNQMVYALEPRLRRFVALAGADDQIHEDRHGANRARHPSLTFQVIVDGRELARSPVMRPGEPAWRFDVELPEGGRQLSLVTQDAGDGNREDLGNWVEAGFRER